MRHVHDTFIFITPPAREEVVGLLAVHRCTPGAFSQDTVGELLGLNRAVSRVRTLDEVALPKRALIQGPGWPASPDRLAKRFEQTFSGRIPIVLVESKAASHLTKMIANFSPDLSSCSHRYCFNCDHQKRLKLNVSPLCTSKVQNR